MTLPLQFPSINPGTIQPDQPQNTMAPLIAALLQREQMRQSQEQLEQGKEELKLRQGDFKLKQEEAQFKTQQRQETEQAVTALLGQLGGLQPQGQQPEVGMDLPAGAMEPEPPPTAGGQEEVTQLIGEPPLMTALSVRMLAATGEPANLRAATDLVAEEINYRRAQIAAKGADTNTPEGRAALIAKMAVADPRRAQALAAMFQTMGNRLRTQLRELPSADGRYHSYLVNMDTGEQMQDFGVARQTYTDRLNTVGDNAQRTHAEGAVRMGTALQKIAMLSVDATALREAASVVSAVTGTLSFPMGVGDFLSTAIRVTTQSQVSPVAQELLNNLWDFLAGRAFASGGKQLTKSEWDFASRSFAPLAGEAPNSWNDKLQRMYRERNSSILLAGPAWNIVSDMAVGWSNMPGQPQQGQAMDPIDAEIEKLMREIQGKKP